MGHNICLQIVHAFVQIFRSTPLELDYPGTSVKYSSVLNLHTRSHIIRPTSSTPLTLCAALMLDGAITRCE